MTTHSIKHSISRSPLRLWLFLIPLALAWFALSRMAQAQLPSPAPDGGYPGNNTAEGDNALFNLDTSQGTNNTATGYNALFNNTTGLSNTATSAWALYSNTTGFQNTANGVQALYSNTTGANNTANGVFALISNTTGFYNTATGVNSLYSNATGSDNTANGFEALIFNTTGNDNTAIGANALEANTTGFNNTAIGFQALFINTTGSFNTATGWNAMSGTFSSAITGNNNTADGSFALLSDTSGSNNTAIGFDALYGNTTGFNNTATGLQALNSNTIGNYITATGQGSLYSNTTGSNNTATGQNALRSNTTGSNNIALGSNAGFNLTTGSNNIDIFDRGVAGDANTIRIGKQGTQRTTFIAGISGATVPTGVAVIVDSTGHLGTTTSSARYKNDIRPMDKASEAILALKPVTFCYKKELDPDGIQQFGLVAEEVEKVNPDLVARDGLGKPYTVRYEAVNAMLLNEFLKEHKASLKEQRKVEEQGAMIAQQQKQIEALTVGLQKVSAQLEASKPAPQVVKNP